MEKMEKSKLMKLPEVLVETRMAKTKLYRLIKEGRFPAQIEHGDGSVVWSRQQIDEWIDNLIKGEKLDYTKVV